MVGVQSPWPRPVQRMTVRLDMMTFFYRRGERRMRLRRLTSALLFVLAGSLFVTASVAWAGPKEDVAATTMTWAQTLGQNDPDKVVLLYATDGVLWGRTTLSGSF